MDSINAQQPEKNHEDLSGKNAVERIRQTVKKTETCFFCPAVSRGGSTGATRPMRHPGRRQPGQPLVPQCERKP